MYMLDDAPPPDRDTVYVLIGGKVHTTWTDYEIDSDLLIPADAWSVEVALPQGVFPEAVKPGAEVEVRIGSDTVLTGRIDDVGHRIDKMSHRLSLSGRDGAAILVDCSAPIFTSKKATLAEIIESVVKPLGISKYRIDAADTAIREKISIEPGMTAWDALVTAAEANGLWPWFEPDGMLVVGGPDYSQPPAASLVLRQSGDGNNVIDLNFERSISGRYSETSLLGQSHGTGGSTGNHAVKAKVSDPDVPVYRPHIVIDSDVDSGEAAQRRARKIQADAKLKGTTLTATVKGHRTSDGELWTPGQRIQVISEPHGLDGVYFLMARRFVGGATCGKTTRLKLVEDGVWVLDAKPEKDKGKGKGDPKKRKGRGKGGTAKKSGEVVIINVD